MGADFFFLRSLCNSHHEFEMPRTFTKHPFPFSRAIHPFPQAALAGFGLTWTHSHVFVLFSFFVHRVLLVGLLLWSLSLASTGLMPNQLGLIVSRVAMGRCACCLPHKFDVVLNGPHCLASCHGWVLFCAISSYRFLFFPGFFRHVSLLFRLAWVSSSGTLPWANLVRLLTLYFYFFLGSFLYRTCV